MPATQDTSFLYSEISMTSVLGGLGLLIKVLLRHISEVFEGPG